MKGCYIMLFAIQWLGGVYCVKKMNPWDDNDWAWVVCIFIGWIFILYYVYQCLTSSGETSSSSNSSPSSLDKEPLSPDNDDNTSQNLSDSTLSEQTRDMQEQTANNTISNEPDLVSDFEYMELLKQYYSKYGEEAFLPSKIQNFIASNQFDSKLGIKSDDVMKDLLKISRTANIAPEQTTTPPVETEQSQIASHMPRVQEQRIQSQTVNTTPQVQSQSKQNQTTGNSSIDKYPFDIRYSPELCFLTNTSLSDKFPENVGQGEMVIRYSSIDMDIKIVEYAIIVDDCLLQFSEDGKMYVLNIPDNTVSSYNITGDNEPQDLLKWVRESVLRSQKQINVLYKTPNALQWLKLYTTILSYHTTHTISRETYAAAMRQLRQGFKFAPDDETIRIDNRQWYYGNERKTWGNIALNIFRDYFKEFTTYHN